MGYAIAKLKADLDEIVANFNTKHLNDEEYKTIKAKVISRLSFNAVDDSS